MEYCVGDEMKLSAPPPANGRGGKPCKHYNKDNKYKTKQEQVGQGPNIKAFEISQNLWHERDACIQES